ncbi:MAG: GNAT family protein [Tissierellia bacterium]|nr:GNAT family protein [Tissierellia bacterium]
MKNIGTKKLETDRLILRRFKMTDSKEVFENWASDDRITEYLTWEAHKSENITKQLLSIWTNKYKNKDFYQWAIVLKEIDEIIGSINVEIDNLPQKARIGYCIAYDYWGNGYTTEALRRVIKFLFEQVNVNKIETKHSVLNPASGKVMEKAGMIKEAILKESDWSNAGITDTVYYRLLKSEYER